MTNSISDEEIRVAAYYLWEKEGRPEGVEFDFWVRAKNELAKGQECCSAKKAETVAPVKASAPVAKTPANKTVAKSKKK